MLSCSLQTLYFSLSTLSQILSLEITLNTLLCTYKASPHSLGVISRALLTKDLQCFLLCPSKFSSLVSLFSFYPLGLECLSYPSQTHLVNF